MSLLKALFIAVRPKQWAKNVVIFAALVFDRQLGFNNPGPLLRTIFGFVIFCLLSGAVYLVNDIQDIEADRQHPTKRKRPIAAGELPKKFAAGFAVAIFLFAIPALLLALAPVWVGSSGICPAQFSLFIVA